MALGGFCLNVATACRSYTTKKYRRYEREIFAAWFILIVFFLLLVKTASCLTANKMAKTEWHRGFAVLFHIQWFDQIVFKSSWCHMLFVFLMVIEKFGSLTIWKMRHMRINEHKWGYKGNFRNLQRPKVTHKSRLSNKQLLTAGFTLNGERAVCRKERKKERDDLLSITTSRNPYVTKSLNMYARQ